MIASIAVPATASARVPAAQKTGTCVVVGGGSAGRRHLRNLATLGIESVVLRTYRGQAGALDGWHAVRTWDEVARFSPTMAIIANPTELHVDAGLAATRLGCDILIEKPVSARLESALELQEAVHRRGTTALVGYQFRYHPTLRTVKDWIDDGVIGEPLAAHAHWGEYLPGWHPDEDHRAGYSARQDLGGGAVLTLSHPLDYLRWLLGEVTEVGAMTARRSDFTVDVEDIASLSLRMESGLLATVTLDYIERPGRHTLSISGSEGNIFWDAGNGVARAWHGATQRPRLAIPVAGFERNALFLEELRHFVACHARTETPRCTLHDGVRAVAVAQSALRSASEGRIVHV